LSYTIYNCLLRRCGLSSRFFWINEDVMTKCWNAVVSCCKRCCLMCCQPFVAPKQEKCDKCDKSVYAAERLEAGGRVYHKLCFKCSVCKMAVRYLSFLSSSTLFRWGFFLYSPILFCSILYRIISHPILTYLSYPIQLYLVSCSISFYSVCPVCPILLFLIIPIYPAFILLCLVLS